MTSHNELFSLFKENTGKTVATPKKDPDPNLIFGYQRSRFIQYAGDKE